MNQGPSSDQQKNPEKSQIRIKNKKVREKINYLLHGALPCSSFIFFFILNFWIHRKTIAPIIPEWIWQHDLLDPALLTQNTDMSVLIHVRDFYWEHHILISTARTLHVCDQQCVGKGDIKEF